MLLDFSKVSAKVKNYFKNHLTDLDLFFQLLQAEYGVTLLRRNSLVIFDEIQKFPRAREAIKTLVQDGRFDYIETGSLISIHENVKDILIPSEERSVCMFPMDFEEFCTACKVEPVEVKSSKNYTTISFDLFKKKFKSRVSGGYVVHPKNFKEENGVKYIPIYMTFLL